MLNWLQELQQRWVAMVGDGRPPIPYLVTCPCGQPIQGQRTPRAQTLRCPNCRAPVFVLGRSPLPPMGDDGIPLPPPPARWQPWLLPLGAVVATLILVGIGFTWFLIALSSPSSTTQETPGQAVKIED